MKRYMLTEPGFFGSLLAPGSIITEADLGKKTVKEDGKSKEVQVKPPASAVEVDENGVPKDKEAATALAAVIGDVADQPIAAVAPFSPNPTQPQGAPAQHAGGLQLAEKQLATAPAEGVESNEAAEAREEQAEAKAETVEKVAAKAEEPKRRGKK